MALVSKQYCLYWYQLYCLIFNSFEICLNNSSTLEIFTTKWHFYRNIGFTLDIMAMKILIFSCQYCLSYSYSQSDSKDSQYKVTGMSLWVTVSCRNNKYKWATNKITNEKCYLNFLMRQYIKLILV